MIQFQGFQPESMPKIANSLGYNGDMQGFQQYLDQNKDKQDMMNQYTQKAQQMAAGGMPNKYKGFSNLPEDVQQKIDPDLASKYAVGGMGFGMLGQKLSGMLGAPNPIPNIPNQGLPSGSSIAGGFFPSSQNTTPAPMQLNSSGGPKFVPKVVVTGMDGKQYGNPYKAALAGQLGPNQYTGFHQFMPQNQPTPASSQAPTPSAPSTQTSPAPLNQQTVPTQNIAAGSTIQGAMTQQALNPGLPQGSAVVPVGTQLQAGQLVNPQSGQVVGQSAAPTALAGTQQANQQTATQAGQMQPTMSAPNVQAAQANAAQGTLSRNAVTQAAQTNPQQLSQLGLQAAQGQASQVQGAPSPMQMTSGQQISGSAVDQSQVQQIFGQQPLQATTVSGELDSLMQDFQGGKTPAWAAGAMRAANAAMAARGLGASSMAGMAVVQAAMESALPIAQMDASNKQQIAVESARQRANFLQMDFNQAFEAKVKNAARVSEIANINFSAEQQVALENAKMAQTMNLANLSNSQAKVMADAASMSQMDMANLNNRQQAAVQSAQAFLQNDMANLSNKQQSEMFNAQTRAQSLFTDQAAANAAQQFNATSQMQTDQFFSSLASNNSQFNASQSNAQAQFNAGQVNVLERFNTEINNQRDQFNAQNRLVIDQANAQWRRQIATADTAAVNRSNEINAASLLGVSQSAYNNLWQTASDNMEWAWTSAENERKRVNDLAMVKLQADSSFNAMKFKADADASAGFGKLIGSIFTSDLTNTIGGSILGGIIG